MIFPLWNQQKIISTCSCALQTELVGEVREIIFNRYLRLWKYVLVGGNKMDFKKMTDSELAKVMVNYIGRVEHLQNIISWYLQGNDCISTSQIKAEYAQLKEELREDAHYLSLKQNSKGSDLYKGSFAPSIREAAAFGVTVSVNANVNQTMFNAVAEAHYKLTKYYSLEEWGSLL